MQSSTIRSLDKYKTLSFLKNETKERNIFKNFIKSVIFSLPVLQPLSNLLSAYKYKIRENVTHSFKFNLLFIACNRKQSRENSLLAVYFYLNIFHAVETAASRLFTKINLMVIKIQVFVLDELDE